VWRYRLMHVTPSRSSTRKRRFGPGPQAGDLTDASVSRSPNGSDLLRTTAFAPGNCVTCADRDCDHGMDCVDGLIIGNLSFGSLNRSLVCPDEPLSRATTGNLQRRDIMPSRLTAEPLRPWHVSPHQVHHLCEGDNVRIGTYPSGPRRMTWVVTFSGGEGPPPLPRCAHSGATGPLPRQIKSGSRTTPEAALPCPGTVASESRNPGSPGLPQRPPPAGGRVRRSGRWSPHSPCWPPPPRRRMRRLHAAAEVSITPNMFIVNTP